MRAWRYVWGWVGLGLVVGCGDASRSAEDTVEVDTLQPDGADNDTSGTDDTSADVERETDDAWVRPPDRTAGERRARTRRCDDLEPDGCLLPWPSSAFLTPDPLSPTGVRIAVEAGTTLPDDGVDAITADGFSRISPIMVLLPSGLTEQDVEVRLFDVESGEARAVDLRQVFGRSPNDRDVLIAYPRAPLSAGHEHLVLVLAREGTETRWSTSRTLDLALGAEPTEETEATISAYHAPARAIVAALPSAEKGRIVRLWDFVTRSADDPRAPLRALADAARRAVVDGDATITLDKVEVRGESSATEPGIAMVVEGHIDGLPEGESTFTVPFRVVVPRGQGDYRFVLYSHGTSGNVRDTAFDELIADSGAAKVNVEIDGWTEASLGASVSGLLVPIEGSRLIVEKMRRSFAGIAAIHAAIEGPLGELLGAEMVLTTPNPTVGRKPRLGPPIWAGGSLGGTVGAVYGQLEPSIAGGVLNVPGAGFTHWLAQSSFTSLLDLALAARYPAMVDQQLVVAMSQNVWDQVDGAIWADARTTPPVFLVQISIGDPVMPPVGTHMVGRSLRAVMTVPEGVAPIVGLDGLERAPEAIGRSAYTEFKTDETSASAVHGFAATNSAAGLAARDQIEAFIQTLWDGAPRIEIPQRCQQTARPGVCDFSL